MDACVIVFDSYDFCLNNITCDANVDLFVASVSLLGCKVWVWLFRGVCWVVVTCWGFV